MVAGGPTSALAAARQTGCPTSVADYASLSACELVRSRGDPLEYGSKLADIWPRSLPEPVRQCLAAMLPHMLIDLYAAPRGWGTKLTRAFSAVSCPGVAPGRSVARLSGTHARRRLAKRPHELAHSDVVLLHLRAVEFGCFLFEARRAAEHVAA